MDREYHGNGVRFRYPGSWELVEEREDSDQSVSITVNSPETAFWSLTLFFSRPDADEVLELALDAFRDEYKEMDSYAVETHLCGRENVAKDVDFYCLELLNSAFLRSFQTDGFTALVLYQGTDADLEDNREILEGISTSLDCDLEDEWGAAGLLDDD